MVVSLLVLLIGLSVNHCLFWRDWGNIPFSISLFSSFSYELKSSENVSSGSFSGSDSIRSPLITFFVIKW